MNALQSNALTIHIATVGHRRNTSLEDTQKYLLRSGLTLEDLKKLSFIHVAGTKGKVSYCMYKYCYKMKTHNLNFP